MSPVSFARSAALVAVSLGSACGLTVEGYEFSGAASGAGGAAGPGGADGSASGSATAGAGGGVTMCTPGAVEPCYTGPAGTKGVGPCQGGTWTCNASGDGFGPCEGETTPVPESCKTLQDDDCDGLASCVCAPAWENVFGSKGNDDIGDIATDASGNVYIASRFHGDVGLGGGVVHKSKGKIDVLVAKLDPSGAVVWGKSFGGKENDRPFAIAVTAAGEVVVGGLFEDIVDFGAGNVNAQADGAAFVVRLKADGSFANMAMLNGTLSELLSDLAVDAMGNAYVVGSYEGVLSAGNKKVSSLVGIEGYIVKVSPLAEVSWVKNVTGMGAQRVNGVAVEGDTKVYITGAFESSIDLGKGAHASKDGLDVLLAQLSAEDGAATWSQAFGGLGHQGGARVGVAGSDVVFGGNFDGEITIGPTKLTEAGAGEDLFVARLPASGMGSPAWVKRFGSLEDDRLQGLAIEAGANVLLSGSFQKTIEFGGPGLSSVGGADAFFAKLSAEGAHLCSRRFGGNHAQAGRAVAAGVAGAAFLAGEYAGNTNFGFGVHGTPDTSDLNAFLLKLAP